MLTRAKTRLYLPYFEENAAEVDGICFTSTGGAYATLFPSLHALYSQKKIILSKGVFELQSDSTQRISCFTRAGEPRKHDTEQRFVTTGMKFHELVLPTALQPQRLQQQRNFCIFLHSITTLFYSFSCTQLSC